MAFDPSSNILSFLFFREVGIKTESPAEIFRQHYPKEYERSRQREAFGAPEENWLTKFPATNLLAYGAVQKCVKEFLIAIKRKNVSEMRDVVQKMKKHESPLNMDSCDDVEHVDVFQCAKAHDFQGACDELYRELILSRYEGAPSQLLRWAIRAYQPIDDIYKLYLEVREYGGYIDVELMLSFACKSGYLDAVLYLLEKEPWWRLERSDGLDYCLSIAIEAGNADVVAHLIEQGAKMTLVPHRHRHRDPFYLACTKGHIAVVKVLFEKNQLSEAVLNNVYQDEHLGTSFFWGMCWRGDFQLAQFLIDKGLDGGMVNLSTLLFAITSTGRYWLSEVDDASGLHFLMINGIDVTELQPQNLNDFLIKLKVLRDRYDVDFVGIIEKMLEKFIKKNPEENKLAAAQNFLDALNRGDQDAEIDGIYGDMYEMCKPLLKPVVSPAASPRKQMT